MRVPLVLLLLIGCGPSLVGTWKGDCEIDDVTYDIELDIEEDDGEELAGEADIKFVLFGSAYDVNADLEGVRDGDKVEIELDLEDSFDPIDIEGDLIDKNLIDGECHIGPQEDNFELERDY